MAASRNAVSEYGIGLSPGFTIPKCSSTHPCWSFAAASSAAAFQLAESSGSIERNPIDLVQALYSTYNVGLLII